MTTVIAEEGSPTLTHGYSARQDIRCAHARASRIASAVTMIFRLF